MAYEKKLIEGNFPCGIVGAETQRERGASSALPPLYFLHVWWARRPLTPSRAAILGSILPANTNPDDFVRNLGIVKKQVIINSRRWTLVGKNLELIQNDGIGEYIPYSEKFDRALAKENERRRIIREKLDKMNLTEDQYEEQLEDELSMIDAAKTTVYKLSPDEEVALTQIDAMKEEINLIVSA